MVSTTPVIETIMAEHAICQYLGALKIVLTHLPSSIPKVRFRFIRIVCDRKELFFNSYEDFCYISMSEENFVVLKFFQHE